MKKVVFFIPLFAFFFTGCATDRNPASDSDVEYYPSPTGTVELKSEEPDSYGKIVFLFRRQHSHIQGCYRDSLRSHPELAGKTTVVFSVNDQGKVTKAKFKNNVLKEKKLSGCILNAVKKMDFGKLNPGENFEIEYPLYLNPKKGLVE